MASLFEGFEYDIFISYRQKDNKGNRWVSEFVEALKVELEATFKEDISIYFDENPHDGLLETHDVDASLKEKLRCLIFIPVISRTYCDPKSFAWEHEFRAFIEQAGKDRIGLKIKLPSGNVSTRVLPVRIHELDIEDTKLCESVLGSVLRGVDFIYKSPGVNRPLMANEEHPKDNLNKTYYRDQINKVANAIDEIIKSLKWSGSTTGEKVAGESFAEEIHRTRTSESSRHSFFGKKLKRVLAFIISTIILFFAVYFSFRTFYLKNIENTLAFLPLRIVNNDTSLKSDGDYFIEALIDKMDIVKGVRVIPTISTYQYRNTGKSLKEIGKELKTNYLVDGNIRLENNVITIWVELSAAKDNKKLWSSKFAWDQNRVSQITREIVQIMAYYMEIKLSPNEEKQVLTDPSRFADANMNFISANVELKDAWFYYNYGDKLLDSSSFSSAIEKYDKAIRKDSLFAKAYANRAIATSWGYYVEQLDSTAIYKCKRDIEKALSIDKDLYEAQIALGFYYYYCDPDFSKAINFFTRASEMDPENYQPLYYKALVYRKMGKWNESMDLIHKVLKFNPQEALFLTNIGLSYDYTHNYDSALIFHQKAIDLVPGWTAGYKNKIQTLLLKDGKTPEARSVLEEAIIKTGENMIEYSILLDIYEKKYTEALAKVTRSKPFDFGNDSKWYLVLARLYSLLNNIPESIKYYDSAAVKLSLVMGKYPSMCELHSLAGIAYAGLGAKSKAIAEGEKAITLAEKSKVDEVDMKLYLAQILTMVGDFDNAIISIAYLLNNESYLSEKILMIDPVWMPLMSQPEFKNRIRKYSKK
jgi:tetratricopeptide (TPR) repeat protein